MLCVYFQFWNIDGSSALTLTVQHVAAGAEEEQEVKKQSPAPATGRPGAHPHVRAPRGGFLRAHAGFSPGTSRLHPPGSVRRLLSAYNCPCLVRE